MRIVKYVDFASNKLKQLFGSERDFCVLLHISLNVSVQHLCTQKKEMVKFTFNHGKFAQFAVRQRQIYIMLDLKMFCREIAQILSKTPRMSRIIYTILVRIYQKQY